MPPKITFSNDSWTTLLKQAESAYPFEGCGLLLAPFGPGQEVSRVVPLENTLRRDGRGRFDFVFSAQEFAQEQLKADRDNLDVVGIYHSHPDHPPRPSVTDTNQPMLSGWVSVIVSVHGDGRGAGQFRDAKAWWREEDGQPFLETVLQRPVHG